MDYLLCIPARETNTRENCEKIHNVLARMSDTYKLRSFHVRRITRNTGSTSR